MSKLFNLKKWLTIEEAAQHLSILFGEEVTEADVLRLGLDGHLTLSVNLVNHAKGRRAHVVPINAAKMYIMESNPKTILGLVAKDVLLSDVEALPDEIKKGLADGSLFLAPRGDALNDREVIQHADAIITLTDIWDLPMIGAERLDVEHAYQIITGGPPITLTSLGGAFVKSADGDLVQLQESFDNNEHQPGSLACLEKLKETIANNNMEAEKAESLLSKHKKDREKYLENKRSRPASEDYYPAGGLPNDSVIVVRTEALRDFERSINSAPTPTERHPHISDKLARMNQAAAKFWANAERTDRGTHPDNATVAAWLVQQGFSQTLADKAATIIRPEWAPTGRKPEE